MTTVIDQIDGVNAFSLSRQEDTSALFTAGERYLRLRFVSEAVLRVTYTEGRPFSIRQSRIVVLASQSVPYELSENEDAYVLRTSALRAHVLKRTGALRTYDAAGRELLQEPERGGKWLVSKEVTRNLFDHSLPTEEGQSIDGVRAAATKYTTVLDRVAFEARLDFVFGDDEALFGLGSHEEGFGNLRGHARELYQQNMKAVVPHLVSSRGYGVLLDCESLMTFHDDALGSYWWADTVEELDFYVLGGGSHRAVLHNYRLLTGPTPLPPRWAFGFVQSKERYVTAEEMLAVVREHRRRGIPLDCIVLDWKSWPNGLGWGQKNLDPERFPSPAEFIDALHKLDAKLMVSIWPVMTGNCPDQHELHTRGLMLGNQSTYDAYNPQARQVYWRQAERGLFANGVDAWWCDCTEPFEADWSGAVKPEPHRRLAINTEASKRYLDAGEINSYSLLHAKGIYEGQRATSNVKRVLNLTRSSYAGQHRYGTVTWNGDVCGTWETLRRTVAEGLHFCATGEAYWTTDVGGFFLAYNPELWFWRGNYNAGTRGLTPMDANAPDPSDIGCTDGGFHELYTRWLQYAVFLPMFRSHGTDAAREAWRFPEPFYRCILQAIRLRYRLLPYLYSLADAVTTEGMPLLQALALAFPSDRPSADLADQFLCGPSLMVCPVLGPILFNCGSQPIAKSPRTRTVWLPTCEGWFDFFRGGFYTGGQTLETSAPLHRIPVFVRAGSIVPISPAAMHTGAAAGGCLFVRVYTGADASFCLYEDEGDGYAYEHGACARVAITWREAEQTLTLGDRQGSYPGMASTRTMRLLFFAPGFRRARALTYEGITQTIREPFR